MLSSCSISLGTVNQGAWLISVAKIMETGQQAGDGVDKIKVKQNVFKGEGVVYLKQFRISPFILP